MRCAFAAGSQDAVAVLRAEVGDVGAGDFEDPQTEQAEPRDEREVPGDYDPRLAVSKASNCRWVNPTLGDSGGAAGRRTCSAGEWSKFSGR
jgi:hypothetical protein